MTKSKPGSGTTAKNSRAKKSTGAKGKGKGILASAIEAVASIFATPANDAVEVLKRDHRKVEDLFAKVKDNEDGNNAATFMKIKEELDAHTHIEEVIFYPHLMEKGDKELKKIVREGLEEHTQVKVLLVELAELSGDSPVFKAKLKVLMENVEHHVSEEEDEMFKMVNDQIPGDTRVRLGSLMMAEKAKVGKRAPQAPPKSKRRAASSQR